MRVAVLGLRRDAWRIQGGRPALTSLLHLQQRITPVVANGAVRTYAADAKASPTEVSSILEQRIRGVQEEAGLAETGRVLSVGYAMSSTTIRHEQYTNGGIVTVLPVCTA